ncbi:hypothetical protein GCM10009854_20600 [Saccharopolyspora halophila]|uniref:Uncharacterized protein n=1 Tax=Saccharopolyspora halophila TaxID=405551 RepID=A0ABN3G472_9PSEU
MFDISDNVRNLRQACGTGCDRVDVADLAGWCEVSANSATEIGRYGRVPIRSTRTPAGATRMAGFAVAQRKPASGSGDVSATNPVRRKSGVDGSCVIANTPFGRR